MPNPERRIYANHTRVRGGAFDLVIGFGYQSGVDEDPEPQVDVAMSWQHAMALIKLLQRQVDEYQAQVGELPDIELLREEEAK